MKIFKELDSIYLTKPIHGEVIGDRREVVLPEGTIATVVLVHGSPTRPSAYEIEVYLSDRDCYVLATLGADDA